MTIYHFPAGYDCIVWGFKEAIDVMDKEHLKRSRSPKVKESNFCPVAYFKNIQGYIRADTLYSRCNDEIICNIKTDSHPPLLFFKSHICICIYVYIETGF